MDCLDLVCVSATTAGMEINATPANFTISVRTVRSAHTARYTGIATMGRMAAVCAYASPAGLEHHVNNAPKATMATVALPVRIAVCTAIATTG